jgi:hypothetical protein
VGDAIIPYGEGKCGGKKRGRSWAAVGSDPRRGARPITMRLFFSLAAQNRRYYLCGLLQIKQLVKGSVPNAATFTQP